MQALRSTFYYQSDMSQKINQESPEEARFTHQKKQSFEKKTNRNFNLRDEIRTHYIYIFEPTI